ncbi:hypothetical protein AX774_g3860 [Zancudomyces culisetae]|uniref:Uncharacterized protein n=1 Tax=Zancudomyces culisetae TaxID=1213189 RepID=A0A1R1PNX2_ZANCU|nr:hypothetical protein AX774_g3860 [Zancudomyces culisetae]|eukprot:OMH82658.1 hypothetical protein AX774_g3860 [Zancudomyces culisetae]
MLLVYLVLSRKTVHVPTWHEYNGLNAEQKLEIIQRLDSDLGRGNYEIKEPKPLVNMDGIAKYLDYAGIGSRNVMSDKYQNIKGKSERSNTLGFDKVYVISSATDSKGRVRMRDLLKELGVKFEFVRKNTDEITKVHMDIYQRIVDNGYENGALILSDSTNMVKDVRQKMVSIRQELGENWDLLCFSCSAPHAGKQDTDKVQQKDNKETVNDVEDKSKKTFELDSLENLDSYAVSMSCATTFVTAEYLKHTSGKSISEIGIIPVMNDLVKNKWLGSYGCKDKIIYTKD